MRFFFLGPLILQSDNGREFVNQVIQELMLMWPTLKLVNGSPRHPQSQGSVERSNQDIENMITSWCSDNKTPKWSRALMFVQYSNNVSHHSGIGMSPSRLCLVVLRKLVYQARNYQKKL